VAMYYGWTDMTKGVLHSNMLFRKVYIPIHLDSWDDSI